MDNINKIDGRGHSGYFRKRKVEEPAASEDGDHGRLVPFDCLKDETSAFPEVVVPASLFIKVMVNEAALIVVVAHFMKYPPV
jgi:hypothetical protein